MMIEPVRVRASNMDMLEVLIALLEIHMRNPHVSETLLQTLSNFTICSMHL